MVNTELGPGEGAPVVQQIHTLTVQEAHLALIVPEEPTRPLQAALLLDPVIHVLLESMDLGPVEVAPVVQRVSIPALQAAVLAADVRRASTPALQAAVLAVDVHIIRTRAAQEGPLVLVVPVGLITTVMALLLPVPADHVLPVNTDLGPGEVAVVAQ